MMKIGIKDNRGREEERKNGQVEGRAWLEDFPHAQ